MELKTWEDAETAATEFAKLTSQLEIIGEELREFCQRRHDAVGKARVAGPVIVGFRKVPANVAVNNEGYKWVRDKYPRYIITVEEPNRAGLREFLRAYPELRAKFAAAGVVYRDTTEAFYLKLARQGSGDL